MIIKYLFCSRTSRFVKFYLVFIISFIIIIIMQFKKSLNKNSLLRGSNRIPRGSNRVSKGSNRVLLTITWVRSGYCRVHDRMAPLPSFNTHFEPANNKKESFNGPICIIFFTKFTQCFSRKIFAFVFRKIFAFFASE